MPSVQKYTTTRTRESQVCPGVIFHLRRMTEGRRIELRTKLKEANAKMRILGREQDKILETPDKERDVARFMELQDEADSLTLETINPTTLLWGVKSVEGLEIDGKPLSIEDWADFPSELFLELINCVKEESGFTPAQEKNSFPPTTSSGQAEKLQEFSTAKSAKSEDTIDSAIVGNSSLN